MSDYKPVDVPIQNEDGTTSFGATPIIKVTAADGYSVIESKDSDGNLLASPVFDVNGDGGGITPQQVDAKISNYDTSTIKPREDLLLKKPTSQTQLDEVLASDGSGGTKGTGKTISNSLNQNENEIPTSKAVFEQVKSISDVDLPEKMDKPLTATTGNLAQFDEQKNVVDSGKKLTDFVGSAALNGKIDKPVSATSGNIAVFDANKNTIDSGKKVTTTLNNNTTDIPTGNAIVSRFTTTDTTIATKIDKVAGSTVGNLPQFGGLGALTDSGKKVGDFALVSDLANKIDTITSSNGTVTATKNGTTYDLSVTGGGTSAPLNRFFWQRSLTGLDITINGDSIAYNNLTDEFFGNGTPDTQINFSNYFTYDSQNQILKMPTSIVNQKINFLISLRVSYNGGQGAAFSFVLGRPTLTTNIDSANIIEQITTTQGQNLQSAQPIKQGLNIHTRLLSTADGTDPFQTSGFKIGFFNYSTRVSITITAMQLTIESLN